uniref:USP domain-containing protein n=1 Tax=Strongyloides papillosus TaxID=174720 RepID=A0A0N5BIM1_STREA
MFYYSSNVDFYDCLSKEAKLTHKYTTYDLLCNIVHDGKPDSGTYRIQLLHKATKKWFELEDMHVKEILAQSITLTESYIQIWKLNRKKTRAERMGEVPSD